MAWCAQDGVTDVVCCSLNVFMALGPDVWKATRAELTFLLTANSALRRDPQLQLRAFHAADSVTMQMPAQIGDYTVSPPAETLNPACFLNCACHQVVHQTACQRMHPATLQPMHLLCSVCRISTPRESTLRMWARCSGIRARRCCPTGCTCRSDTTAGPRRWSSAAQTSLVRRVKCY